MVLSFCLDLKGGDNNVWLLNAIFQVTMSFVIESQSFVCVLYSYFLCPLCFISLSPQSVLSPCLFLPSAKPVCFSLCLHSYLTSCFTLIVSCLVCNIFTFASFNSFAQISVICVSTCGPFSHYPLCVFISSVSLCSLLPPPPRGLVLLPCSLCSSLCQRFDFPSFVIHVILHFILALLNQLSV